MDRTATSAACAGGCHNPLTYNSTEDQDDVQSTDENTEDDDKNEDDGGPEL